MRKINDAVNERSGRTFERGEVGGLFRTASQVGPGRQNRGGFWRRNGRSDSTGEDLVDVRNDFDGLADDEQNGDRDQDNAEIGLAFLPGSHFGLE